METLMKWNQFISHYCASLTYFFLSILTLIFKQNQWLSREFLFAPFPGDFFSLYNVQIPQFDLVSTTHARSDSLLCLSLPSKDPHSIVELEIDPSFLFEFEMGPTIDDNPPPDNPPRGLALIQTPTVATQIGDAKPVMLPALVSLGALGDVICYFLSWDFH
jgi:hypothetical protein